MLKPPLVSWSFYILLSDLLSPPTHDSHTEALWLPDNENMFAAQICVNAILYLLSADVKVRAKKPQTTDGEFSMARETQRLTCAPLFLFSEKIYTYIVDVFLFFFTKSDWHAWILDVRCNFPCLVLFICVWVAVTRWICSLGNKIFLSVY